MNRIEEATRLTEQSLAMFRTLYGENHLDVAENLVNLGVFLMQSDHIARALPVFDEAIAIYRRLLPAIILCSRWHSRMRPAHSIV